MKEILQVWKMFATAFFKMLRRWVGKTRIHLNTEQWRVCETWFSPNMAGVDSAGIGEVVQNILAAFSTAERARLAQVNFKPWDQLHGN